MCTALPLLVQSAPNVFSILITFRISGSPLLTVFSWPCLITAVPKIQEKVVARSSDDRQDTLGDIVGA